MTPDNEQMMENPSQESTMRDGLAAYLGRNGFPPDGGDSQPWAVVRLGPIPIAYPNLDARRRAVRVHDLNHVVTGYATDLKGESEISAWEVGSGCGQYWVAWLLGLSGLVTGARWPIATARAFSRGRQTQNLYQREYESTLDEPISTLHNELGLDRPTTTRPLDIALLLAFLPASVLASAVVVGTSVVTAPWWIRAGAHRERREPA